MSEWEDKNSFVLSNIDTFLIRKKIRDELRKWATYNTGIVLDVGCGEMPYRELVQNSSDHKIQYLGMDLIDSSIYKAKPDLFWDGSKIPLRECSVDFVMSTECLEHCLDPLIVLREAHRIIKPGGEFFFTVPFLWPLHDVPSDYYRYTPFALRALLEKAGFNKVTLTPSGGWDLCLAQMMGLWVRRRPMNRLLRYLLSLAFYPFLVMLSKLDMPSYKFEESSMSIGISGVATK